MALLVYASDELRNDARNMGVTKDKVNEFAGEIEASQSTAFFDRFPPPFLTCKKKWAYNNRLIAAEQKIGEHLVVLLLRLLVKGNEYQHFENDPETVGQKFLSTCLQSIDLQKWVTDRTHVDPPEPLPMVTDAETEFLWSQVGQIDADDVLIYETADWVKSVDDQRIRDRLAMMPGALSEIIDGAQTTGLANAVGEPRVKIAYRWSADGKRLLLVSALFGPTEDEIAQLNARWDERLGRCAGADILRVSVRSYPALICYDADIWLQVQKEPAANLAMSPEEAEILNSVRRMDSVGSGFPLFINGRAGSGKSTILQYLFADYYAAWIQTLHKSGHRGSRPLYFACSNELVEVARGVVSSLLAANHNMLLKNLPAREDQAAAMAGVDKCFCNFHTFLLNMVPAAERAKRFPIDKRVSYARFRRMWEERHSREPHSRRDFGPQVSWHVIRTYIKGLSVDSVMQSSDDYEDMPREERSVSHERFKTVFDRVWSAWFRDLCGRDGYWDEQDLARFLIEKSVVEPRYSSIFCDEAQDFTRLEIELLYRLSLFSNRSLNPQDVRRVPFVFAGDPFQTLHPTGFRWEAVKAGFTERVLCSLHRFQIRRDIPELNYRELSFNYRSTENIVRFCNSIQAVRAAAFALTSLRPQSTWNVEESSPMPVYFRSEDPRLQQAIREQKDLVIIVPCEEGDEKDFVQNDELLRDVVECDEYGTPQNVLSPARSKGQEFNRVLMYGFGSRSEAKTLADRLAAKDASKVDRDQALPLEYFMNGLYVAASRARRRLFIVDNEKALADSWGFATEEDNLRTILKLLPRGQADWWEHCGMLAQGVPDNWSDDRDDPRALAKRFEEEGFRKEDAYLLRQAAIHYGHLKMSADADKCKGFAARFERDYLESGRRFAAAGMSDQALSSFWCGEHHEEVVGLISTYRELVNTPEARVSSFLRERMVTTAATIQLLEYLIQKVEGTPAMGSEIINGPWSASLGKVLQRGVDQATTSSVEERIALASRVDRVRSIGVNFDRVLLARVMLAAGRFEDVMTILEADKGSDLYRDAYAQSILRRINPNARPLSPEEGRLAADFLTRAGKPTEASGWYAAVGEIEKTEECLRQIVRDSGSTDADVVTALSHLLKTLCNKAHFQRAFSIVGKGEIDNVRKESRKRIVRVSEEQSLVYRTIIPELAVSDAVVRERGAVLQMLAVTLSELLMTDATVWNRWRPALPIDAAGAAIERVALDIDALRFYERVQEAKGTTPEEKEFARRRWIRCKFRQVQREERQAEREAEPQNLAVRARATEHKEEANRQLAKNGWKMEDLGPEFPLLGQLAKSFPKESSAVRPREVESTWTMTGLAFKYFPSTKRVNIESERGDRARLDVGLATVLSEDVVVTKLGEHSYNCESWNLQIEIRPGGPIIFRVGDASHELRVS